MLKLINLYPKIVSNYRTRIFAAKNKLIELKKFCTPLTQLWWITSIIYTGNPSTCIWYWTKSNFLYKVTYL